jgi:hypothetical protein
MSPHSDRNATAAWEDEGGLYFESCMSLWPNLQQVQNGRKQGTT